MKPQIATTPEQSKRLLACGVNPDSADMFYTNYTTKPNDKAPCTKTAPLGIRKDLIPAWSLSALLALLPTSLTSAMGNKYMLELSKLRMHNAWEVQWFNGRERWCTVDKDKKYHKLWDESPLEACVKAIEWLTANGYTLNTK